MIPTKNSSVFTLPDHAAFALNPPQTMSLNGNISLQKLFCSLLADISAGVISANIV
ncbi:MAG: hypothetical protein CFH06_00144 [Alphaproteobacteria bacterium MarineAlpha3_Bin5]|nr:MAG: hypothetical protein CFH06_00144 [Alphaproteobacteria bacterium MarineAlpha3_Bin5]|tara:strand:+ start:4 stop:171 length:168 start_codon:yes stop_codon:yes gene_type:complete